ncbi:hypothetical protein AAVH_09404 [Aphelenchoides avenae]|nr:hypothetical protein AAVH_09404 [Aphelenchus avenae]
MNRKLEQDERENAVRLESDRRKGERNPYEAADRTADTFEASPDAAAGGNDVKENYSDTGRAPDMAQEDRNQLRD